ncbi:type VII toxin-antitoxin system MntA family adenylyltransferase antitoxin [Thermoflexus sp.]|uniref:type VII toxin-antitoxin system MntA family adenylyltransferase antitoxin n=1 Tax=Thermoflexus sp. TaxID=1969742 RepID=UPI002ADD32C7|nr:nucleotidyltransferase domain-containing protein [Thermoflexus sp.]
MEALPPTSRSELPPILSARLRDLQDLFDAYGVEFALVFGSLARGAEQPWSDVDIGIYPAASPSLLELGEWTASLELILGRDVDLIPLDVALERNPALAYRAVAEGLLLFCRDPQKWVAFKTRAILRYLDTAFLRAMLERAFRERVGAGSSGGG